MPECTTLLVDDSSDVIVGEICHIKANHAGGPRYDRNQTDEERNDFSNLILLCSTDHTRIDSDEKTYTVEYLQTIKAAHKPTAAIEMQAIDGIRAERLLGKYMVLELQVQGSLHTENLYAQSVHIHAPNSKQPKISLPADVIGGSSAHLRYIDHLLSQYKEFASKQTGRVFRYGAVYGAIQREFGTSWNKIGVNRFQELSKFLQQKIDKTIIGKRNRSKGISNYSTFEQYCVKYGHK